MTNDEINKAIAEACGWKFIPEYCHGEDQPPEFTTVTTDGKHLCGYYPDYLNDLNAMHEAEKILGDKWDVYQCILSNLQSGLRHDARCHWSDVGSGFVSHATAHQRAEAFLKTFNLWVE